MAGRNGVDAVTDDPLAVVEQSGVVPVAVLDDDESAVDLAAAVRAGGLRCLEVTFRTSVAAGAIARMVGEFADMAIGAGTVRSVAQAEAAAEAGACFVVTPGYDPEVVDWCRQHDVPIIPGALTPTEIGSILGAGLTLVKFFPAEAMGGVRALRALAGPFPEARFVPTGGLDDSNLAAYLRVPAVAACGSGWVVDPGLVRDGDFAGITERSRIAVEIAAAARAAG